MVKSKPKKQNILDVFGRDPENMDELGHCVIAMLNQNKDGVSVVGFKWDVTHHDLVSNTHSSPEGRPQNFMCKTGLPSGYPGWTGRVWVRYSRQMSGFGNDSFYRTLTHTGTGGGGSYGGPFTNIANAHYLRHGHNISSSAYPRPEIFSWDYKFYDEDWPAVTESIEREMTYNTLAGINTNTIQHKFEWYDPVTLTKDAEFMAECALIKAGCTIA